jgi:hypothetical protein
MLSNDRIVGGLRLLAFRAALDLLALAGLDPVEGRIAFATALHA